MSTTPEPTNAPETIAFQYRFRFADGAQKQFDVLLNAEDLSMIRAPLGSYPAWTALTFNQCPNCPLDPGQHTHCPAATALCDVVDGFQGHQSYEEAHVEVQGPERKYSRDTTVQTAVSSLIGIRMAASGCPILAKLRPMAELHLPFVSAAETTYRFLAMYLVAQFLKSRRHGHADWQMQDFTKLIDEVIVVNRAFCERLNEIRITDASINAVVILDVIAQSVQFVLEENALDRLEKIFGPLLAEKS